MNSARWATSIVALASLCTPAAQASVPKLHFDGLYCCTRDAEIVGTARFYLRFYPDGVVLSTVSIGTPAQVAKWLIRSKQQHFHYSVSGTSLHLQDENGGHIFLYSGTIHAGYLTMIVDRYDTATRESMGSVERRYEFTPIAMQP